MWTRTQSDRLPVPSPPCPAGSGLSQLPVCLPRSSISPSAGPAGEHPRGGRMLSDLEIAQAATLKPIRDVATDLGLTEDDIDYYGRYKAKIRLDVLDKLQDRPNAKYI